MRAMIGGGVAGVLIGLFSLEAYTFAVPSLLSLPQFISESGGSNFAHALIVTALITWFTTDPEDGSEPSQPEIEEVTPQAEAGFRDTRKIASPLSG